MVFAATWLGGCSSLSPQGWGAEMKHDSGLLVDGTDSRGRLREDSLDVVHGYLWWQIPTADGGVWYAEAGAGMKWREGGFYTDGSKVIGNVRFGRRFRFNAD